jgi:hypothetical protein
MLDRITYSSRERKQQDLGDSEECCSKHDITNRPSIIESAEHENELGYYVYDDADEGPEDVDYPEADGFGVGEGSEALECGDGDEECYAEDGETGEAQDLGSSRSGVFS